jgi:ribonuclease HI
MEFTCSVCGTKFTMPQSVLDQYPGWTPRKCRKCHDRSTTAENASEAKATPRSQPAQADSLAKDDRDPVAATEVPITAALDSALDRLLERHTSGPDEGVFTDGGCSGNPGPGGWGAVLVRAGQVVDCKRGEHPDTTNNRMELIALMAGFGMIGPEDEVTVWSDSQLCVNTFNEWAAGWKKKGWRRKGGPIKNLDLIQPLYDLIQARPRARLRWIKAHDGSRWNEYVDLLATAHLK